MNFSGIGGGGGGGGGTGGPGFTPLSLGGRVGGRTGAAFGLKRKGLRPVSSG